MNDTEYRPWKVDFMIIGAMKCGTSTAASVLRRHPNVSFSTPKETHFFSTSDNWRRELERYERFFPKKGDYVFGEASTSYSRLAVRKPGIWDLLYEYNPALKLVYIIRNPLDQITSSYMHIYERGYTDLSFNDAVKSDNPIVEVARYHTQIKPFLDRFGESNVLILNFENLVGDKANTYQQIFAFLGLPTTNDILAFAESARSNKSLAESRKIHHKFDEPSGLLGLIKRRSPRLWRYITDNRARSFREKPVLDQESRALLADILNPEVEQISDLTGFDLGHWQIRSAR